MLNNEPLQQLQSSRNKWRGWVTPPAVGIPPAINALPATGGPDPWDSEKKVPRWLHTMGNLRPDQKVPRWPPAMGELEILICMNTKGCPGQLHTKGAPLRNGPSHLAPQGINVRWHLMKGGYHCQGKAWGIGCWNAHMMLRHKRVISCSHCCGRQSRQYHKKWQIGQDHEGRPKPIHLKRKMQTLSSCCNKPHLQWLLGVEESTWQVPMWEMAYCCHHQCHLTPTTTAFWRPRALPLACLWLDRVVHQVCSDTVLVGGAGTDPRPCRSRRIHQEGVHLL